MSDKPNPRDYFDSGWSGSDNQGFEREAEEFWISALTDAMRAAYEDAARVAMNDAVGERSYGMEIAANQIRARAREVLGDD